jgi:hypothetical protein
MVPSAVPAIPQAFDGTGNADLITQGQGLLCLDYLGVRDNRVQEDGADYPYGRLWLILYDPGHYDCRKEMKEEDWAPADELDRLQLPGPSDQARWSNDDEMVYRNFGVLEWKTANLDRLVFRIIVDDPTASWETDTLAWGVIEENDSLNTVIYETADLTAIFRTTDLPELTLAPAITISDVWFVHNVKKDNMRGLEVHIDYQVDNMRTVPCRVAAFIHTEGDATPVECAMDDPKYRTSDGHLTVQEDFVPIYTNTSFSDVALFIPYDAFPVSDDFVSYYAVVQILDAGWHELGSTESVPFEVRRPGQTSPTAPLTGE